MFDLVLCRLEGHTVSSHIQSHTAAFLLAQENVCKCNILEPRNHLTGLAEFRLYLDSQ